MKKYILGLVCLVASLLPLVAGEQAPKEVRICEFLFSTNSNVSGFCNGERISLKELYKNGWRADTGIVKNSNGRTDGYLLILSRPIQNLQNQK